MKLGWMICLIYRYVSLGAAGVLVGHPFDTVKVGFFSFHALFSLLSRLTLSRNYGLRLDSNIWHATTVWGRSQVTPGYRVHTPGYRVQRKGNRRNVAFSTSTVKPLKKKKKKDSAIKWKFTCAKRPVCKTWWHLMGRKNIESYGCILSINSLIASWLSLSLD